MRIESITLREIQLALKEPFQISSGTVTHRRILLLQVRSADGIEASLEPLVDCPLGTRDAYYDYASYECLVPVADYDADGDGLSAGTLFFPADAEWPDLIVDLDCDNCPDIPNDAQEDIDCDDVGDVWHASDARAR